MRMQKALAPRSSVFEEEEKIAAWGKLARRNHVDLDYSEAYRVVYAELFDIPHSYLEAVARTERGDSGYEMGQRSIHASVKLLAQSKPDSQEFQAARTLDRFAWRFLLENPILGEVYRQKKKRVQWEQEDFLTMFRSKYLDYLAEKGWPDPRRDDIVVWRKNMGWFVWKWTEEHR